MIAIIDYGMGNLRSVQKAFELFGAEVIITDDHEEIKKAEKIILPGVGSFLMAMKNIKEKGLDKVLTKCVIEKKVPFLGICLGMQLIAKKGYEDEECAGLGWVDAEVVKFDVKNLRLPHIGWNNIKVVKECELVKGIEKDWNFYFVHSFHIKCNDASDVVATCNYGYDFAAFIKKGNIYATQFHPEKSQVNGLKIIENFFDM
jgi:glutamine amidotransferase